MVVPKGFLNKVNFSYFPFFITEKRECLIYGGAGAGKSYACAQKVILFALNWKNKKILVLRKTLPSLKLTCMEIVRKLLEDFNIPFQENKVDNIFTLYNRSQIIFKAVGENEKDFEKIKSITDVDMIWIDEPTEISEKAYNEIQRRLRGQELPKGQYRQIVLSFNPIDRKHWIYKRYFEKENESFKRRYTYKDNRFVDAEYKKMLEALKEQDEYTYQVYCLGEWGTLKGQIYSNYVIGDFDFEFEEVFAGVDFGYNNPSVYLLIGVRDGEYYIVDEIYEAKLVNSEFVRLIKEKNAKWRVNPVIYCEIELDRIEEMRREGLRVVPAKKDVIPGINYVKMQKLHIHERCVNTIKEIQGYRYKEDRAGNVLEEPVKFNDHAMDAMRYAIYTRAQEGKPFLFVYNKPSFIDQF